MSHSIRAVYDSGVFRPLEPVDLAEGSQAVVFPIIQPAPASREAANGLAEWPSNFFEQTAGALAGEHFERPSQGDLPQRESW